MVDEPNAGAPGQGEPVRDRQQAGRGIVRGLLGILGLAAILNYLFGLRLGDTPAPVTAPPPPVTHAEEVRHADGRIEHPRVHFETRDANFRWVIGLILSALVFAAFTHWVLWVFFLRYDRYQSDIKKSPYPLATTPANGLPRGPRLEQVDRLAKDEQANVYVLEAKYEAELASYGTTPEKGYVHVPIDVAMDMLIDKLPARKEAPASDRKSAGLLDSGEPNSGRIFREEPTWQKR